MINKKNTVVLNHHDVRELKAKLHHIKPTIIIDSKGLTEEIFQDIDRSLNDSELIKIRTQVNSSEELVTIAEKICAKTKAVLIQTIGYIIAIYRKNLVTEE